ncbi:RWD domain-containing protein 1 [Drosophila guanche]|uniref:Blast:RWD domain-containing protein 1 n=1 Tax=Drosophila guanche TaxID=7266 RepID=A0A3B0KCF5_DROGU|nr:RWD domain-containing protein 1 [Drosophila guanche]SPP82691.1 blast:RWD domain-containing protein 1 [Drosophila guanche]
MSRNYKEDQSSEVEALDSIYCGEMEILATEPFHKFQIPIATEEYNAEENENGLSCKLVFTYTATYPDAAPLVEIEEAENFEDTFETRLLEHLRLTIEENLGMEMIFSLVSSAQEWLNQRWDEHTTQAEETRVKKLREVEEEERKKFEGTRVSVETFMKWKLDFEESTGIAAKREKINDCKKLTGRELFMCDTTLNDSDIKFLLEAGENIENVKIDETLFQDIGELDLDDDDDEDWVPGADDDDD